MPDPQSLWCFDIKWRVDKCRWTAVDFGSWLLSGKDVYRATFPFLDSIHRTIYLSLATTKSCLEGHLHTLMRSVDQVLSVSIFWQVCLIHVVTELGAVVAIPIVLRHVVKVRPLFFVLSVLSSMYHKLLAW